MKKLLLIICSIAIAAVVEAQIIHVPADYPTIQQGINAAASGDTILVSEGTYYENINFLGKKPLLVASQFIMDGDTSHINNTIINGSQPVNPDFGSVVTYTSGEDTTSVLCGFTITGGTGTFVDEKVITGAGVFIQFSGGTLLNNHIEYNEVNTELWSLGGGVCAGGPVTTSLPWVVLRGNRINHNKSLSTGVSRGEAGGFMCEYNLIMTDNQISYNEANGSVRCFGGGVYISGVFEANTIFVKNNIITHNKAKSNTDLSNLVLGGGLLIWRASGMVAGNIFSFNETEVATSKLNYGSGVFIQEITENDLIFENNLIQGNTSTGGDCNGGGLSLWMTGGIYQNNVIQNNTGTNGGGIYVGNGNPDTAVLINNTITENNGATAGGLYISGTNAVVINTIIWGNTASSGASIYTEGSSLEVRYSDVEGDDVWPGEGNVNCNASFLEDGYHLSDTCQLVEKGIASILINGTLYECPAYDIDGDGRPSNAYPEIGADEVLLESIAESDAIENFKFFPNPADQLVTISLNSDVVIREVSIYNQLGQYTYTVIPDNNTLDISKLLPGIYIIELVTDQGKVMEKLIVD